MNTQELGYLTRNVRLGLLPARRQEKRRSWRLALLLGLAGFAFAGCAADGYVGVAAYPDYSPYYGYYGYGGAPYFGYGGIYNRTIVIRGVRHAGGYGRQHFWRDRGRANGRPAFSGPPRGGPRAPAVRPGRGRP